MLQERLLEGQQNPDLDVEFETQAEPLTRLSANPEEIEDWLRRHEAHIRATSGQPPPPPPPPPRRPVSSEASPYFPLGGPAGSALGDPAGWATRISASLIGVGGLLRKTYTPEDAEEFERRVKEHLEGLRTRLLDQMLRQVAISDCNKITFAVGNETDDSVSGIKLTVIIPQNGLLVFTSPPEAEPLPRRMPRWPDPATDFLNDVTPAVLIDPHEYDFSLSPSVMDKGDSFEVTWNIGDLRPRERSAPCTLTIVVGPNAPDELEIELVARSLSHRRTATSKATVTVDSETLTIDDFYDPSPRDVLDLSPPQ
jgi:hypothetical protein